jgi:hypothetical protein
MPIKEGTSRGIQRPDHYLELNNKVLLYGKV